MYLLCISRTTYKEPHNFPISAGTRSPHLCRPLQDHPFLETCSVMFIDYSRLVILGTYELSLFAYIQAADNVYQTALNFSDCAKMIASNGILFQVPR